MGFRICSGVSINATNSIIGSSNTVYGNNKIIIGNNNRVIGDKNIIEGNNNVVKKGDYNILITKNNQTLSDSSNNQLY